MAILNPSLPLLLLVRYKIPSISSFLPSFLPSTCPSNLHLRSTVPLLAAGTMLIRSRSSLQEPRNRLHS